MQCSNTDQIDSLLNVTNATVNSIPYKVLHGAALTVGISHFSTQSNSNRQILHPEKVREAPLSFL